MTTIRGDYAPPMTLFLLPDQIHGSRVLQPLADRWGGFADATYVPHERVSSSGFVICVLESVFEWMPPIVPYQRRIGDDVRLPMPTVAEEVAYRLREWEALDCFA